MIALLEKPELTRISTYEWNYRGCSIEECADEDDEDNSVYDVYDSLRSTIISRYCASFQEAMDEIDYYLKEIGDE